METTLFYQNKKLMEYFFKISLFLGLALVISCSDSIVSTPEGKDLNTIQFTYDAVEYIQKIDKTVSVDPNWPAIFVSNGIVYTIEAITEGANVPREDGVASRNVRINSENGTITIETANTNHSGDYLVTATATSNKYTYSIYTLGNTQTTTFSLSVDQPNLNSHQFTYDAVEYAEGSTTNATSSPTWQDLLSSTGITYSIAAATSGNIPDQDGITDGAIIIDSNTGVITVNNATSGHSGDYLVTATAGSTSEYTGGSTQTTTFTLSILTATAPGTPALSYALRIDGLNVRLTPNVDNPYGINADGSLPTSASYNFYYTPTSSFTTTPTPQEVKSSSAPTNISDVTGRTSIVIPDLSQDTEYYIVVEAVHAISSKTTLSEVFTKRTASIQASDRANLCTIVSDIIATNNTANLNHIDTSQVTDMSYLFSKDHTCAQGSYEENTRSYMDSFNGDLSEWDTINVNSIFRMFRNAINFNGDISGWDTANVKNMVGTFYNSRAFNQDISGWNTSKVTTMTSMFLDATSFNQDISGWNTTNVADLAFMFYGATSFNQDISGWNTINVSSMFRMFKNATNFNSDISSWDTSNVNIMSEMFNGATSFNQNISGWVTYNVTDMSLMFYNATAIDQDFSNWNVTDITTTDMFTGATSMQDGNYPQGYTP